MPDIHRHLFFTQKQDGNGGRNIGMHTGSVSLRAFGFCEIQRDECGKVFLGGYQVSGAISEETGFSEQQSDAGAFGGRKEKC